MSNWDKPFDAEETLERAERLRSLTEQAERLMHHAKATLVSTPHPNGQIPSYLSGISKSLDKVLEETYAVAKPPPESTVPGMAYHLPASPYAVKAYGGERTGRLVVAGDYAEFMHYCNRERINGAAQVFLDDPDKLRGLSGRTIYLVGNYGAQVEVMEAVWRLPKEDFPLHVERPL